MQKLFTNILGGGGGERSHSRKSEREESEHPEYQSSRNEDAPIRRPSTRLSIEPNRRRISFGASLPAVEAVVTSKRHSHVRQKSSLGVAIPDDKPTDEAIDKLFEELILPEVPADKQGALRSMKVDTKWKMVSAKKMQLAAEGAQELKPSQYVDMLEEEEYVSLDQAMDLKVTLRGCSKAWLVKFYDLGGLQALVDMLTAFQSLTDKTDEELRIQCELLKALKAAMNNQLGLDQMIRAPELVASLALNLDCEDVSICRQTLELLAVLMVTGAEGHRAVLDAMEFFKMSTQERVRFYSLVDALFSAETSISFKLDLMLFINTVVVTAADLEERIEIRADLVYTGILEALENLKSHTLDERVNADMDSEVDAAYFGDLQELEKQIEVFESVMQKDTNQVLRTYNNMTNIDLSDPEQIFRALHSMSVEYECFTPFLNTLQYLLVIPSVDSFGKTLWESVESALCRIVTRVDEDVVLSFDSLKTLMDWKERLEELAMKVQDREEELDRLERMERVLQEELNLYRVREMSKQDSSAQVNPAELGYEFAELGTKADSEELVALRNKMEEMEQRVQGYQLKLIELDPSLEKEFQTTGQNQSEGGEGGLLRKQIQLLQREAAEARVLRAKVEMLEKQLAGVSGKSIGLTAITPGTAPPPAPPLPGQSTAIPAPPPLPGMHGPPSLPGLGIPMPPPLPGATNIPAPPPLPGFPGTMPPMPPPLPGSTSGIPAPPPLPGAPVPPPLPGMKGPPMPPPLPGMGGPPMPPPLPGMGGPPMPPPLPGMGGPPMAPPLPGMGGPPMPPMMPGRGPPAPMALPAKPKKAVVVPGVPMRSLFWTKIPEAKIDSTIWRSLSDNEVKLDTQMLEENFCKNAPVKKKEDAHEDTTAEDAAKTKSKEVNLLDPKVLQNVGIALAKYRMPSSDIRRAVLAMDEEKLDSEKVTSLRALAPTPDDIQTLKDYEGDVKILGKVEKFFMEIMTVPRYTVRLDCFLYKLKFREKVEGIQESIDIVWKGVHQMQASSKLLRIMEVCLAIGNYLNGNTPRGGLYGFKLDGLLKLATVKSIDNKSTLLNFLVNWCEHHDPELLSLAYELDGVHAASKVPLTQVNSELTSIQKGLDVVTQQIEAASQEHVDGDAFDSVMTPFKTRAEMEVQSMHSEFKSLQSEFNSLVELHGEDPSKSGTEEFFGMIQEFVDGFQKAFRENEKRRILLEKAVKAKDAEEKRRASVVARKRMDDQAQNLVDNVFGSIKSKGTTEIVDSLAGSSKRFLSRTNIGRKGMRKTGHQRINSQEKVVIEEEEFHLESVQTETQRVASMMSRLGRTDSTHSSRDNAPGELWRGNSIRLKPALVHGEPTTTTVPERRGSNVEPQGGELEAFFKRKRDQAKRVSTLRSTSDVSDG